MKTTKKTLNQQADAILKTVFLVLVFITSQSISSQNLVLDETYGENGIYSTVASKMSGKVVLDGTKFLIIRDKSVIRLNADGSPDLTFGVNGTRELIFDRPTYAIRNYFIKDSQIYLCGTIEQLEGNRDIMIVKLDSTGNFDATFGINGVVLKDFGEGEELLAIYVSNQNEIIATGSKFNSGMTFPDSKLFMVKLLSNGSFDPTYYNNGLNEQLLTDKQSTIGYLILPSSFNKYYVLIKGDSLTQNKWGILKLNQDFTIDLTFGTNGFYITPDGNIDPLGNVKSTLKTAKINSKEELCLISNENFFSKINLTNQTVIENFEYTRTAEGEYNLSFSDLILYDDKVLTLGQESSYCQTKWCREDFFLFKHNELGERDTSFNNTGKYNITENPFFDEYQPYVGIFKIEKTAGGFIIYGVAGKNDGYYKIWSMKLKEVFLSVNDFSKQNQLFITPNPTNGLINISLKNDEVIKKVSIYTVNGSKIVEKTNSNSIDLSSLSTGLYSIQVETENSVYRGKVIKE